MPMHVLKQIKLESSHKPTQETRHLRNGMPIAPPESLWIVQYDADSGYYLLYLDAEGHELTDTYHETIDSAMEQARWEFQIRPEEWRSAID